jgi:dephospho-CoA kinase
MILIGLTGGPGTGKSLAAEYLKRQGAVIISGDDTGREVLEVYPAVLKKLVRSFGDDILESNGILNRRALGRIVFGDPKALKKLNDIIHPHLLKSLKAKIDQHRKSGKLVVVDAALIFEWGIERWFDYILVVTSKRTNRIERLMYSGLTRKEVEGRIRSQIPQSDKAKRADFIITNNSSKTVLRGKVNSLLKTIKS